MCSGSADAGYNGFGRRFVRIGDAACSISGIVSRASTITWRGVLYDVRNFSPVQTLCRILARPWPYSGAQNKTRKVGYSTSLQRISCSARFGFTNPLVRLVACLRLVVISTVAGVVCLYLSSSTRASDSDSLMKYPRFRSAFATRVKAISCPFYCEYSVHSSVSHSGRALHGY